MPSFNISDIVFIINPNSGKKEAYKILKKIRQFDNNIASFITSDISEARETIRKNLDKFKVFVIVGGDGSVNEAAKIIMEKPNKYIAVFPSGSGNGFAYELGFKKNLKLLINEIKNGEIIDLDILHINDQLCINVSGSGIDSYVAYHFNSTQKRGLLNYILLTIKAIFCFKPFKAYLKINNVEYKGLFNIITIANTRQFGNNAIISPLSKPDDGIFEIIMVKPLPFYLYPLFVIKMFTGTLKKSKYIDIIKTSEIVYINSDYHIFHIDGNPVEFQNNINIEIHKKKLKVIKTDKIRKAELKK
jgi:YegS/Rv2252/BmrU family lipid kinase